MGSEPMGMGDRIQAGEHMKKTSTYAKKRGLKPGQRFVPGHAWLSALERCRPFDTEPVIPGLEGTAVNAEAAALMVRDALDTLINHRATDCHPFDLLAHAVDVAHIRALQIQPNDSNPMHAPLIAGKAALQSVRERFERLGAWGVSSADKSALVAAVEHYETVLFASSPDEMARAAVMRSDALDKGMLFARVNASGTGQEPA